MYKYVHGGDVYSARQMTDAPVILDFSSNINPLGLPEEVKHAIIDILPQCEKYPDPFCRELVSALATYEQTHENLIFCSNGAAEIIFRLALALKPQKGLLLAPTFADYEKALHTVGCEIDYHFLSPDTNFSVTDDILESIDNRTDLVVICNPNNPTGQLSKKTFLKKVLDKCLQTNTFVLVDECFIDFIDSPHEYSVKEYIQEYDNLLILKAFTKVFAMPGIRLGYSITSNTALIEQLRLSGQDWSVSTIAQAAGICAVKQRAYLDQTKPFMKTEREFVKEELKDLGLQVYGSQANYIFFKADNIRDLDSRLLAHGILIRSCSNYINLDHQYYRVAVKKHAENIILLAQIKDVLIK